MLKETKLYNEFGEPEALSVNLNDVAELIRKLIPNSDVSVHYDDYDDYGCEHYILVKGECANLKLQKDYGGMYCPTNGLVCTVNTKQIKDLESTFKYKHSGVYGGYATSNHSSNFHIKNKLEDCSIYSKYEQRITEWINSVSAYLKADSTLFYRTDNINYPDLRGEFKWGNGITSYDSYIIADEDFYTDSKIRHDAKREKVLYEESNENPYDYF